MPLRHGMRLLRRFWPFLRPERSKIAIIALMMLLSIPAAAVPPFLIKYIFDVLLPGQDIGGLAKIGVLIVGLFLFSRLMSYIKAIIAISMVSRINFRVMRAILDHLLRLPLQFHDDTETGQLMSRARDDAAALRSLMPDCMLEGVANALKAVLFFVLLFFVDSQFSLWGLALVCLVFGALLAILPQVRRRSELARERDARSAASLHEALMGIFAIRTSAREGSERIRFSRFLKDGIRAAVRRDVFIVTSQTAIGVFQTLGVYAILAAGIYRIIEGTVTIGVLLAFFLFLSGLVTSAGAAFALLPSIQVSLVSLERIFKVLNVQPEPSIPAASFHGQTLCGEIEFVDVSLTYGDGNEAIRSIDLKIGPGEVLALVGRSGSGKSTLAHAIPRLYELNSGQLLIDGKPVESYPLAWLRSQIGIVPQEVTLFNRTIYENIAYANPFHREEKVYEAARAANVDVFAQRLPQGYATIVGERGVHLSGGERQRIGIAREILSDPSILILDEVTANLDAESEAYIREAMERIMKERTCIVIAHRLSMAQSADRIVVLDEGKIVEDGTHDELLSRGGIYELLYRLQFSGVFKEDRS